MKSTRHIDATSLLVLLLAILILPAPLWAQVGEAVSPPRDTLIAAARQIMEAARFCALITIDKSGHPRVRTMDPFPPEDDMVIWLGTNRRTRKVEDIRKNPRVTLFYLDPHGSGYASIDGTARLVDDAEEKALRWKTEWEQFYPDRETSYLLIEVTPLRLEVVNYTRGVVGKPKTWLPPSVEFNVKKVKHSHEH